MASHDDYLAIIRRIPKGKVATYKDIAILACNRDGQMSVGDALRKNKQAPGLPWWRVVAAGGKFGGNAPIEQRTKLEEDGVGCITDNNLDLLRYRWDGQ